MSRCVACVVGVVLSLGVLLASAAEPPNEEHSVPGLFAIWQSMPAAGEQPIRLERGVRLPRIFARAGESPLHELPAGSFQVTWSGYLNVPYPGTYTFTAQRNSLEMLRITLDGKAIKLGESVEIEDGEWPIEIAGSHRQGTPAFELWWRADPQFADEPIDTRFFHYYKSRLKISNSQEAENRVEASAVLAETLGCFRCHEGPAAWTQSLGEFAEPLALLPGPKLERLGSRVQSKWLVAWLKNPQQVRPDAHMPAMLGDSKADELATRTIAAGLLAATPSPESKPPGGDATRGEAIYKSHGCSACHITPERGPDLWTASSAPNLDDVGGKWIEAGLVDFLRQPLATRAHGRMPDFGLSEAEAADVARYLFARKGAPPPTASPTAPEVTDDELDEQWKQLGGEPLAGDRPARLAAVATRLMAARSCFNCHAAEVPQEFKIERFASGSARVEFNGRQVRGKNSPSLVDRADGRDRPAGCLGPENMLPKSAPRYGLPEWRRSDLLRYVSTLTNASAASTTEQLSIDMAVLNCARCHENEGRGGEPLAKLLGDSELAKFSLPPTLTRAGERLRPERLEQWIASGARQGALRPWTAAHMPGFGARGKRVAAALAVRDGANFAPAADNPTVPKIAGPKLQAEHVNLGRQLVSGKALACVNCHALNGTLLSGKPDPTTRSPDLTLIAAHLRPEYFQRWMMNPARIRPNTKMPQTIRPDGTVPIPQLSSHPPGTPLAALWTYLSQGKDLQPPADDASVLVEPTVSQPVVQRGEVHVDGNTKHPRGIALGFSEGTVVYDADRLAPVALWFDGFVKPASHYYFGVWWQRSGGEPERLADRPHALSFRLPKTSEWQAFELPLASDPNSGTRFEGVQVGKSSVRLRYRLLVGDVKVAVTEDVGLIRSASWQGVSRQFTFGGLPAASRVAIEMTPADSAMRLTAAGEKLPNEQEVTRSPLLHLRQGARHRAVHVVAPLQAGWVADNEGGATRLRLALAPLDGTSPVEVRVDEASFRGGDEPTIAQLVAFARRPLPERDAFDRALAAPATVAAPADVAPAAPAKPKPTRPAVNHQLNFDEFAAVKTRFVRFRITATENNAQPGIDELEVFGRDPDVNLALAGKATAENVLPGYAIHQIPHLNDGKLGNNNSWIAKESKSWAQIEFAAPTEVSKVVWARDRTGVCKDRLPIGYRIEVSDDGVTWKTVCDDSDRMRTGVPGMVNAEASPGYRIEALPLPFEGCRPSDVAFSSDGTLYALAMTEGQIWRTKLPPAARPELVAWQRYATGLNHPVGMALVDGRLFVAQKPEISELVDRDGDGVVDEFRTVASGWGLSTGVHEYTFGLAVDRHKNLWVALNTGYFWTNPGHVNPGRWRGSVIKASFLSDRMEVVAKGCRVPNGIACGPDGGIFFTDNQGDWTQSCKVAHVVQNRFYGHPEYKEDALPEGQFPTGRSAVWMPYNYSRSTSGPVHDETAGKFGPFAGQMFVGDVGYGGNPGIMRLALEKVNGEFQGAVLRFVDGQPHGVVRMKFGPDDQLYIASLTTGLARMKFVGPTPLGIQAVNIRPAGQGFVLRFTKPLVEGTVLDPMQFRVRRYHYLYTGNYGSPEADSTNVTVEKAELSSDRLAVTLTFPVETYPLGMVYEIHAGKLMAEGNEPLPHQEAWYTVYEIPK